MSLHLGSNCLGLLSRVIAYDLGLHQALQKFFNVEPDSVLPA